MALKDSVDDITATCEAVSGLNAPPSTPPEDPTSTAPYPFVVVYPSGRKYQTGGSGEGTALTSIIVEIHTSPADFPKNTTRQYAHLETVENDIAVDPTLGGTCDTWSVENPAIDWSYGNLTYASVPTLGWQGTIEIKHKVTVT